MPIKSDAQVHRTKKMIISAILSLMDEYDYKDITVTQIAQYAAIDRSTYYRHFNSKEEILNCYVKEVVKEYESFLLNQHSFSEKACAISFFTVCQNHKADLYRLHKHRLLPTLLAKSDDLFLTYHNKLLHEAKRSEEYQDIDYVISFFIGGFWHIVQKWVADGMKKTPEQLVDIALQFLPSDT
ncbi:MAG: TetR/AcrR family transcriptional regulator [Lachnospiraceae bacterium]